MCQYFPFKGPLKYSQIVNFGMQLEQSGNPADAGFSGIGSVRKKLQL
jgi:hypothetical protein